MSTAAEKPTLAGVSVKTRKRYIVTPNDPQSFADACASLVTDAVSEGGNDLEAAIKALDVADLEFSRYGDTLFEVFFAGGRLTSGATVAEGGVPCPANILAVEGNRESIAPYVRMFQALTRRRPFLLRGLENTLIKLLLSLEFFDETGRKKISIALALILSLKIGVVTENVFAALLNDRLVTKGASLDVITIFLQEFLAGDSLEDAVAVLTKAKMIGRMMELMPPHKRTKEAFNEHFTAAGLGAFAEFNTKRDMEVKVAELQETMSDMMAADPPPTVAEMLSMAKTKKAEATIPDSEVLRVTWLALVDSINMTGKNGQQIMQAVAAKVKSYHKLLAPFASSGKAELSLLLVLQQQCYEDNRLLKLFADIVRLLYNADILGEDAIMHWYKKGSGPKGRNVFLKDIEPFIQWLENAESDEEED